MSEKEKRNMDFRLEATRDAIRGNKPTDSGVDDAHMPRPSFISHLSEHLAWLEEITKDDYPVVVTMH